MKSLDLIKLLKFHENTNQETRFLEKTTNKHFNIFFSLMDVCRAAVKAAMVA